MGLALALLYISPALFWGQDTPVLVNDTLDSTFVWLKVLVDQGQLFAAPEQPVAALAGVPRGYLPGPFGLQALLLTVLPPFAALTLYDALLHLLAFLGMALLLQQTLPAAAPGDGERTLWLWALLVAGSFALLPFFLGAGVSVVGQPLLFWALLRLRAGRGGWLWLVPPLFALWSGLATIGVFLLPLLLAWGLFELAARRRRAALRLLLALLLLVAGYLLAERGLLALALEGTRTHRDEMSIAAGPWLEAVDQAWRMYRHSHYHAEAVPSPLLRRVVELAVILQLAALLPLVRRRWFGLASGAAWLWWSYAAILAISLFYGFWRWDQVQSLWRDMRLPYLNLARIHWLLPTLWSLALGFALLRLLPHRWGTALALLLCLGQAALAAVHHQAVVEARRSGLTYRQFYAEALFARIKADLGAEAEARVASLGLHPAVAQYNGFHTLDGYFNAYPLAYKHAFRPVIAPALAADPALRRYFDDWGSRLYLFNSALHACRYACYGDKRLESVELLLDPQAFAALGGRFLLSVASLSNAASLGFVERGVYSDPATPMIVHLYELRPDAAWIAP